MLKVDGPEKDTHMPTQKMTNEIIAAAIEGFEAQKTRIHEHIAKLRAMLSSGPAESATMLEAPERKRRKFSAAARKRMKEAQQRRWAKIRGESEPPLAAPKPAKTKRRISEAGMKRIIAATKKRWRLQKAAAKSAVAKKAPSARKKAAIKKVA
jgi:hypothetical protein